MHRQYHVTTSVTLSVIALLLRQLVPPDSTSPTSMSAKRKFSGEAQFAAETSVPKRLRDTRAIKKATAVAESNPRKRKAWTIADPDDVPDHSGKKQLQYNNLGTTPTPRVDQGSGTPSAALTQFIRLASTSAQLPCVRTHVYIVVVPDHAILQPPTMAGQELLIHIYQGSVNVVLPALYEGEAQMRSSGVYELDSVLGFLRGVLGDFEWAANNIGIDNAGLVWAMQQLKRRMGYDWEDGPNSTTSGLGTWTSV